MRLPNWSITFNVAVCYRINFKISCLGDKVYKKFNA